MTNNLDTIGAVAECERCHGRYNVNRLRSERVPNIAGDAIERTVCRFECDPAVRLSRAQDRAALVESARRKASAARAAREADRRGVVDG